MFKKRKTEGLDVKISVCREVLEAVYDECDRYDIDETGGRIIGFYHQQGNKLKIKACGFIGPGPSARRTATSFFQDGKYQEAAFRKAEIQYPTVEHLGNWHTHHVNGLKTLSSGDIDTYQRIVNHEKHNTNFFYILLVVAKNRSLRSIERYRVKHFLIKRGLPLVYEFPSSRVKIINKKAIFVDIAQAASEISAVEPAIPALSIPSQRDIQSIRAIDKAFMSELYPHIKPFYSKQTRSLYWRGKLDLIDKTSVETILLETTEGGKLNYSVTLATSSAYRFKCNQLYAKRTFDSAFLALYLFERDFNREIFEKCKDDSQAKK